MNEYEVNKVYTDEFGRVSGIFTYNKPAGVSSHAIVNKFRKHFQTKKVGHAGTLDPFAEGVLVILVGKATKLSDQLLNKDKQYKARILLGLQTNSGDPEGEILNQAKAYKEVNEGEFTKALLSFTPEYLQYVPVFSSVKVEGQKLRELARKYSNFKISEKEQKVIEFYNKEGQLEKTVNLPAKTVSIQNSKVLAHGNYSKSEVLEAFNSSFNRKQPLDISAFNLNEYQYFEITVDVSKGTYIRQLATDVGEILGVESMLISLTRTKSGEYSINNTFEI
jgi:tRNA pseudouridine55 synthase